MSAYHGVLDVGVMWSSGRRWWAPRGVERMAQRGHIFPHLLTSFDGTRRLAAYGAVSPCGADCSGCVRIALDVRGLPQRGQHASSGVTASAYHDMGG